MTFENLTLSKFPWGRFILNKLVREPWIKFSNLESKYLMITFQKQQFEVTLLQFYSQLT